MKNISAEELRQLEDIRSMVERVLRHMRSAFPHEHEWKEIERAWNGKVVLSHNKRLGEFDSQTRCLRIGLHGDSKTINARALLALSKAATNNARCTSLHSRLLIEATTSLSIPVSIDCDTAAQHGLKAKAQCPSCEWVGGAPDKCASTRKVVWSEFLGYPVSKIAPWFRQNYPHLDIELSTWDSLDYLRPAAVGSVRITYDTRTGLVVAPPPHLGTLNPPVDSEFNCFTKPDAESKMRCIGAPVPPSPAGWEVYIGKLVTEAVDDLRIRYPHAVVEHIPSTASVSSDLRADRIRVVFDSASGRVVETPIVG